MTAEEQRNLALAKQYEELYNTDVERFVRECYAPDYTVYAMGGASYGGYERFVEIEQSVLRAAPQRKMRVERLHAAGEVVVVEAVIVDPERGSDWQLPFCAVLTCREGKIVTDRTYAEFTHWPGLEQLR